MKSKIRLVSVLFLAIVVLLGGVVSGAEIIARVKVSVPDADYVDVPVHAVIELPERLAQVPLHEIRVRVSQFSGSAFNVSVPGQLVFNDKGQVEVWWIIPHIKKQGKELWDVPNKPNNTSTWDVCVPVPGHPDTEFGEEKVFSWQDKKGQHLDLFFDGRKVTRYMYAHDTSSEQRTFETYKPFHHVYDASGNLLTNGPDGVNPYIRDQIRYPHHRGIYIGWNKLMFEGKQYDLWHMPQAHQVHQKFLEQIAGPALARSTVLIYWNDDKDNIGEPIIAERRQTTVFRQSDPTVLLFDFHTELKAVRGDVFLNGDPEHAGFQYRPHDAVAKGGPDVKAKYLFHQEGINPRKDRDMPWVAMSYGLNSGRYSVLYMNHPDNPKSAIYSAYRDYGRFGAFFTKELGAGQTLKLNYRIWVGRGELPARQDLANRCSVFIETPNIEVSK